MMGPHDSGGIPAPNPGVRPCLIKRSYAVAFSPDGKTVLTGSFDKTARLWTAAEGNPIGEISMVHEDRVSSPWRTAPTEKRSPPGATTRRHNSGLPRTTPPVGKLLLHEGPVLDLVFSPDESALLTGSEDKTARLWNAADGTSLGRSMIHKHAVLKVAFKSRRQDHSYRQSRPDRSTVERPRWDIVGAPMEHHDDVVGIAFRPDGKTIATGSVDQKIQLWPVPQWSRARRIDAPSGSR